MAPIDELDFSKRQKSSDSVKMQYVHFHDEGAAPFENSVGIPAGDSNIRGVDVEIRELLAFMKERSYVRCSYILTPKCDRRRGCCSNEIALVFDAFILKY